MDFYFLFRIRIYGLFKQGIIHPYQSFGRVWVSTVAAEKLGCLGVEYKGVPVLSVGVVVEYSNT